MTSGYSYVSPETKASASPCCTIISPNRFGSPRAARGGDNLVLPPRGEAPTLRRGLGLVDDVAPDAAARPEPHRQLLAIFGEVNGFAGDARLQGGLGHGRRHP